MEKSNKDFFWPSYVDLMTVLFVVMLVMFVLSYIRFKNNEEKLIATIKEKEKIEELQQAVSTMMNDQSLFRYDPQFKRYTLAQDVKFKGNKWDLSQPYESLDGNVQQSLRYINSTGRKLKNIVDSLMLRRQNDPVLKNVSYVLVITGSASDLRDARLQGGYDNYCYTDYESWGYVLSYQRALALYDYWKTNRIVDFDHKAYHQTIELVIAGTGYGGVGRYNPDKRNLTIGNNEEKLNQRFLIQIIPKVGEVK
ncbi:hypothetical protein [Adhaeribacter terreus]|uniref:OmpA family protein n=1 Tax=Adhaeribacter terreus TaxID=529703 RepID=A0ABW0EGC6_9BACT